MMGCRFITLLALWISLSPQSTLAACHDYVLISTRGTTEPQGPSRGFPGMINAILSSIPNGIDYDTVYPASTNLSGVFDGATDIVHYIESGLRDCPNQRYALLGYSQGASATNFALNRTREPSSAAYEAIRAVVVIGNPGHVNGSTANVDQDGGGSTRNFTGWYYLGGSGAIPQIYYDDGKVLDICITGDTVCATPPGSNGTEALKPEHELYGSTPFVQTLGAEFLTERLDESLSIGLFAGYGMNGTNSTVATCDPTSALPSTTASTGSATSRPTSHLWTILGAMAFVLGMRFV